MSDNTTKAAEMLDQVNAALDLLSEADRERLAKQHRAFRKDVMSHKGFGDAKLKIKCSGKLGSFFYRAQNKLLRMMKQ